MRRSDLDATILPDGYLLLYHRQTNQAYTLTPLGGLVWEYCDGSHSLEDIVHHLEGIEGLPTEPDLTAQVSELLATLEMLQLIGAPCG